MTVQELIDRLSQLEDKTLPVYVEDGLSPSDPTEAMWIEISEDRFEKGKKVVEIR